MCRRVQCKKCDKPTFSGCGMHVEQVLADVPRAERCTCRDAPDEKEKTKPSAEASVFRRFFGL